MVVFTCGGTGGHIYPLISIAQALKSHRKVFFGSFNRQDSIIVPKYGFQYESLPSSSRNVVTITRAFFKARRLFKRYAAKVLVSSGGYHTFPVVLAAKSLGLPVILLEQNVIPGKVNRWLSRFADKVCVSFQQSKSYISGSNVVVTGNPTREVYIEDAMSKSFKKHWPLSKKVLLVFGGSQGAKAINECIEKLYSPILETEEWTIIHLTGESYFVEKYGEVPFKIFSSSYDRKGVFVFPYYENMKELYELATVVVSRAGATTIAELYRFEKPAVLIPYPYAADNHQLYNAKAYEKDGGGEVLLEEDMTIRTIKDASFRKYEPKKSQERPVDEVVKLIEEVV